MTEMLLSLCVAFAGITFRSTPPRRDLLVSVSHFRGAHVHTYAQRTEDEVAQLPGGSD
jgi:hypothetical protein